MYGKSKASDWRNLNTGAAPKIGSTIFFDVKLKFAVPIFSEQLNIYKNYSA